MKNEVLNSWKKNAKEWNAAIEGQNIPSRKYTNEAVLKAIMALGLKKVADLGCGEGWLCREMTKNQIEATGFDATATLIKLARAKGNERYHQLEFENILKGQPLSNTPFDGAVFNFSIFLKDNLDLLLQAVLKSLKDDGVLLIQTPHPYFLLKNSLGYRSQWLSDSWKDLPGNFEDGHSWYARTMEDWMELISEIPKTSFELREIINEEERPISLLIILKKENG